MAEPNVVMAVTEPSKTGTLSPIELPMEDPQPGEVRIRVRRAGVAFGDILRSTNGFLKIKRFPFVPGYDVAGDVDAVGAGVPDLNVGARVAAFAPSGGYARYVTVDARLVLSLPESVSYEFGTALNINYVSAWQMLTRVARVTGDQTALVTSAAGGVGTALLQLSSHLGLRTWGIASASKHDLVRQLGAIPIDYETGNLAENLRDARPEGWDAAFEARGPEAAFETRRAVRRGGFLVLFGFLSAVGAGGSAIVPKVFSLMTFRKGRRFRLYTGNPEKRTEWYRKDFGHMLELCAAGKLKPVIDGLVPLEEAMTAWDRLTGRTVRGKVVLDTE